MTTIQFIDVTKSYKHIGHTTLKRSLVGDFSTLGYGRSSAIEGISFNIKAGESLGIVGFNGSGKTTLLKLALGLMEPDKGSIVRPQPRLIGSMLSLEAGFHPDFSGIENIKFKCALAGLSKSEVMRSIERIVSFAELEDCIFDPLRTYSAGMSARLAFSIMISFDWSIILIDEVLAVGDLRFQEKCRNVLLAYVNSGGSLLVVSHNPEFLGRICTKGIWLKGGFAEIQGEISKVVSGYQMAVNAAKLDTV
ncbi:ABC transporter ATP-binding protein [Litoricolaceae bacterium]|nr:ABC transporter ATP-binding protein [Litorivicinaceae bacterium]